MKRFKFYSIFIIIFLISTSLRAQELIQFLDIENSFAKIAIRQISTTYGLSGYMGTEYFYPDLHMTKAELAFLFTKIKGVKGKLSSRPYYDDLPKDHWAYPFAEALVSYNIFPKVDEKNFAPNAILNRRDVIVALLRFLNITKFSPNRAIAPDLYASFEDSKWFATAIDMGLLPTTWKLSEGIHPYKTITRAEIFAMLDNALSIHKTTAMISGPNYQEDFADNVSASDKLKIGLDRILTPSTILCDQGAIPINGEVLINLYLQLNKVANSLAIVSVNLTELGRQDNFYLQDNGLWNDVKAKDGIYSGQVRIAQGINPGIKVLPFTVLEGKQKVLTGEFEVKILSVADYQKFIISTKNEELKPEYPRLKTLLPVD